MRQGTSPPSTIRASRGGTGDDMPRRASRHFLWSCRASKTKSPVVYRSYRCSLSLVWVRLGVGKADGCWRSHSRERTKPSHLRGCPAMACGARTPRFPRNARRHFDRTLPAHTNVSLTAPRSAYAIRLVSRQRYPIRAWDIALFAIPAGRDKYHYIHQGWATGFTIRLRAEALWVGFQ